MAVITRLSSGGYGTRRVGSFAGRAAVVASVAGGYPDYGDSRRKKRSFIIDGRSYRVTEAQALELVREATARIEALRPEQSKPARKRALFRIVQLSKVAESIEGRDRDLERRLKAAQEDEEILLLVMYG